MPDPWGRLYPREAAAELKLDLKRLSHYARNGKIGYDVIGPSGHRRYPMVEIERFRQAYQQASSRTLADQTTES